VRAPGQLRSRSPRRAAARRPGVPCHTRPPRAPPPPAPAPRGAVRWRLPRAQPGARPCRRPPRPPAPRRPLCAPAPRKCVSAALATLPARWLTNKAGRLGGRCGLSMHLRFGVRKAVPARRARRRRRRRAGAAAERAQRPAAAARRPAGARPARRARRSAARGSAPCRPSLRPPRARGPTPAMAAGFGRTGRMGLACGCVRCRCPPRPLLHAQSGGARASPAACPDLAHALRARERAAALPLPAPSVTSSRLPPGQPGSRRQALPAEARRPACSGERPPLGWSWCAARLQQPPCAGVGLVLRGALLFVAQHPCLDFKMLPKPELSRVQDSQAVCNACTTHE